MCTRVHENNSSVSWTSRKFYKINCKMNTIIRYHCKIWGFLFCLNNSLLFICYLFIDLLAAWISIIVYLYIYGLLGSPLFVYLHIYGLLCSLLRHVASLVALGPRASRLSS